VAQPQRDRRGFVGARQLDRDAGRMAVGTDRANPWFASVYAVLLLVDTL
jgi:hypothetical protein